LDAKGLFHRIAAGDTRTVKAYLARTNPAQSKDKRPKIQPFISPEERPAISSKCFSTPGIAVTSGNNSRILSTMRRLREISMPSGHCSTPAL